MKRYLQISIYIMCTFGSNSLFGKHCQSCYGGSGGGSGSYTCTGNTTLYVDGSKPDNSGNGFTWTNAKRDLQAAIWIANECSIVTTILVATGIYKPSTTTSTTARDYTFFIGNNYSIKGGYPAGGGVRDWVNNPTILDGNIATNYESYHVLVVYDNTTNVTIDGFRIRNGFADGIGSVELDPGVFMSRSDGSGLYVRSSVDVDIKNCVIYDNVANGATSRGAGFYSYASDVDAVNTVFANNLTYEGGGIYMQAAATTTLTNCTFFGNYAGGQGGAIYNTVGTTLDVFNTIVWGNSNSWNGGGVKNVRYSLIQDNNSQNGGVSTNNIYQDPNFGNSSDLNGPDNIWFNSDDGLNVCSGSICVNRGLNTATNIPINDIANNNRIYNAQVDIGAYELEASPFASVASAGDSAVARIFYGVTGIPNENCKTLATLEPTSPVNIQVLSHTHVASSFPAYNDMYFVTRYYYLDRISGSNFTGKITLGFSNSDFTSFNATPYSINNLPTSAASNKSHLRIIKFTGAAPIPYLPNNFVTPPEIIDPVDSDIVFNFLTQSWRIKFDNTGPLGSYFVTTIYEYVFNGNGLFSSNANWLNNEKPGSTLPAYNTITIQNNSNCSFDVPLTLKKYSKLTVE
jgi:predicted outer membrane repeat protein